MTEGTDAQAEVSVRLEDVEAGKSVTTKSADPDTLVDSAKAYVSALNKLTVKRLRSKPAALEPMSKTERRGP